MRSLKQALQGCIEVVLTIGLKDKQSSALEEFQNLRATGLGLSMQDCAIAFVTFHRCIKPGLSQQWRCWKLRSRQSSGIRFYLFGVWARFVFSFNPKSIYLIPRGYSMA